MAVESYRELIVWQKPMGLAESVYKLTSALPREDVYGLRAQTRRSAVSIASNIAEVGRLINSLANALTRK